MEKENEMKNFVPAVALRGLTVLPQMLIHFDLSREKSILAVEQAMKTDQRIFLVTQDNAQEEEPTFDGLFHVGTIVTIKQITKLQNKIARVLVDGVSRAKLLGFCEEESAYLLAEVEDYPLVMIDLDESAKTARMRMLKELLGAFMATQPQLEKKLGDGWNDVYDYDLLLQQVMILLPFHYREKQRLLEAEGQEDRFEILIKLLQNELEIAKVRTELTEKTKGQTEKRQREFLLREQMQYIRKELGEDDILPDAEQFEEDLRHLKASKEVKEKIRKEISRFRSVAGSSSESAVERAYIETLLEMPWQKVSKDNLDIERAERILNEQHYGLEQVKERILEFLAVRALNRQGESPIICLVGPPGTGKTSIARSVAEALNKKYIRICLGGVRDEAEIRGHRKTYVGAMAGRIALGLKQAGVKNPLMLLDEIDKLGSDYKGDPAAALLEVLDSEQNCRFGDHYIEIPIDLSEVLFIATANSANDIPRPLLDRMELIEVTSYTANEKFHIAKEHLWEKQLKKNGLTMQNISMNDAALRTVIQCYTKESGVRELERKLGEICRKAAREILQGQKKQIKVTNVNIERYLGKPRYQKEHKNENDEIGVVRGLAWTSVGGATLQIEVNVMPGSGEMKLTGQMGDVMKESAMAGMSYVRSVAKAYDVAKDFFKKNDFHIHIPEGAVPKDGPSAGISMATALFSAVTGIQVKADVAMTGEITLRGRVLPVGGLKEKILAAKTAGISTVLVPADNRKDVEEISTEITNGLNICYVEKMEEVFALATLETEKI